MAVTLILSSIIEACTFSLLSLILLIIFFAASLSIGHLQQRIGAAAQDDEDAERRRAQIGGGARDPHRLLLQPRRHVPLPDHGGSVHRPGHQHAHVAGPAGHAAAGWASTASCPRPAR